MLVRGDVYVRDAILYFRVVLYRYLECIVFISLMFLIECCPILYIFIVW